MDTNTNTPSQPMPRNTKKYMLLSLGLLSLAALLALVIVLYGLMNSLNDKVSDLTDNNEKLTSEQAQLKEQNDNLKQATEDFQSQLTDASKGQPQSSIAVGEPTPAEAPKPVGKMVVTGVKDQPGSDFAKAGYTAPQGTQRTVHLTVTNLSDASQTIDVNQFKAVNGSGATVAPRVYSPVEASVWNNSTLKAGESENIVLLFSPDQTLVSLRWLPGDAEDPITIALPAIQ